MTRPRLRPRVAAAACLAAALACGGGDRTDDGAPGYTPPDAESPVALNADSPIQYPPALYDQKIEGDVVLRLFVDSTGRLVSESTRIAESSGYPALDSAALAGAARLRFAPARRRGIPVATVFLQPIEFRHAEGAGTVPAPKPTVAAPRRRPDTAVAAPRRVDTTGRRPPADTGRPRTDTTKQRTDTSAAPR